MTAGENDKVTITLSRDLAISLFEWSYQFMTDHDPTFHHPADALGVDELSCELERVLTEPFKPDYPSVLKDARLRAVAKYAKHMGAANAEWLNTLSYRTFEAGG